MRLVQRDAVRVQEGLHHVVGRRLLRCTRLGVVDVVLLQSSAAAEGGRESESMGLKHKAGTTGRSERGITVTRSPQRMMSHGVVRKHSVAGGGTTASQ